MSALASNSVQKQGNSAWSSGCSCGFSSEGFGLAPGRNILTIPVICGCLRCLLWDRSQAAVSAGGWSVLSARAELSTSFLPEGIQFAGGKTTWQTQPKCSKEGGGALQELISKLHPCTKHSGVDPAAATLRRWEFLYPSAHHGHFSLPQISPPSCALHWQGWHNLPVTCAESQPAGAGGAAVHQGAVHERFLSLVAAVLELRGHGAQFLVAPPEQRMQAVT